MTDQEPHISPTEMADHFLESADHKKYENRGFVFLGQNIREQ